MNTGQKDSEYDMLSDEEIEEANREYERLMQGWMNDLDQEVGNAS